VSSVDGRRCIDGGAFVDVAKQTHAAAIQQIMSFKVFSSEMYPYLEGT